MNITTLKSELSGVLHGTNLNKIQGLYGLINRAARTVLLEVDPKETIRIAELDPLYNEVYNYPAPNDLKGTGIIDIRPLRQRLGRERFSQTYSQAFDIGKDNITSPNYTIEFNTGLKTLRINSPLLNSGILIDDANTDDWTGTVSDITVDNTNYVRGNGALSFNLTATGQYIEKTLLEALDLTTHLNQSDFFYWVYLPDASKFTSISLRIGTDSTNYYSTGNITTQQDGTIFQNGWNLIKGTWASTTGTPTITDTKYIRVTFNTDGSAITATKINNITSKMGEVMQVVYYSRFAFKTTAGAFKETVTDDTDEINLDTESYNVLFNLIALYCVQQAFDGTANFDNSFFQKQYDDSMKRYKGLYKSQRNKPKTNYYTRLDQGYNKYR
jgi:hypothetical protein